jgi:uncharacterized protein YbaR (Trm112 family)
MDQKVEELSVCPDCGYERGFHLFFRRFSDNRVQTGIICPSCGQSYDIEWITSNLEELKQ